VVLLAFANGANDTFKGVATLLGSGTADYRRALVWATATTLAGSAVALIFAERLVRTFSGKGLVPDALTGDPAFLMAVAGGAGVTVLLAARLGFPISTTHALTGALAGAGIVGAGSAFDAGRLATTFFAPLLVSPLLAVGGAWLLYPLLRRARRSLGVTRRTCVCVGNSVRPLVPVAGNNMALAEDGGLLTVDRLEDCREFYGGRVLGFGAQQLLDTLHYLSAGAVSFARGLNDTPKIVALLLAAGALKPTAGLLLVGAAMALGGWLAAGRVAETMSHGITRMNHGQGFTANLVTAVLVAGASRVGMPVSTTHVSCGALFGLGAATGHARRRTIAAILLAWITTLPLALMLGAASFALLR
jgi:PiT family inorganic phosphate transporter